MKSEPTTREERGDYDKPGAALLPQDVAAIQAKLTVPATPWLTVAEAAAYLSVNQDFIYDACATGGLRYKRLAGRRSIRTQAKWLDDWMHSGAAAGGRGRGASA